MGDGTHIVSVRLPLCAGWNAASALGRVSKVG